MSLRHLLFCIFGFLLACLPAMAAESQPLRVMTYNIRYDNPADSLDNWKYRKDFVLSMIRFHAPDILGIQEGLINQVHDLSGSLRNYRWCGVGRDDGQEAGEFSAIFYNAQRFAMVTDSTFWLSPTPNQPSKGWDAALNRIVTWAKLKDKKSSRVFFVFNTHFDHQGQTAREESAKLLIQQIQRITKGKPAILTGDFNSTVGESPYSILTSKTGTQPSPLTDAMSISESGHHGPLKTYSGFDVHKGIIGDRIDFIFVSSGIRVAKHATLTDFRNEEHFPSDHLPVIGDVILP